MCIRGKFLSPNSPVSKMATQAQPTCEDEVIDAIAGAIREHAKLMIVSGGSKSAVGAPTTARALSLARLSGVVDYDPAELVLTVRPGTSLAEVQALVREQNQMLAFDPFDHGPLFGRAEGKATIGGVVAAGVSGSQRVSCGGARDHLLGFRAVSGRGEAFVAGAKVVKNVTGYDLPKLAAGSWGRLFALTELTLKVLPRPRESATRIIEGLTVEEAVKAMSVAMGSQAEIAAAAHIPGHIRRGRAQTGFRVQGFGPSVAARCAKLESLLSSVGKVEALNDDEGSGFWSSVQNLTSLERKRALWRINLSPRQAPALVNALTALGAQWLLDWAGGLVWISFDGPPDVVRAAANTAGGHAILIRGSAALRTSAPTFHPLSPGLDALEARIRRAFDPAGVFETGRF